MKTIYLEIGNPQPQEALPEGAQIFDVFDTLYTDTKEPVRVIFYEINNK